MDNFNPVYDGRSLRDYFIAHAPHEPQMWFEPMLPEKPQLQYLDKKNLSADEAHEYDYFHEYFPSVKPEELKGETLREYAARALASHAELRAWNREAEKQRYIQWPAAWADEMLKVRQA